MKENSTNHDSGGSHDLINTRNTLARPFLKWAGGKGQLLKIFQEHYPIPLQKKEIKNYYEPFLGSGAVFFDLVQQFEIRNAFLYDVNEELVLTYKVIQKDSGKLTELLYNYQKTYLGFGKARRQEFFYEQRANYNSQRLKTNFDKYSELWIPRAARLIFLNRTCYNGLYRVNSKGEFNTPAGDYINPKICNEKNLIAVNKVLQIAEIKRADFTGIIPDLKPHSFVYFDPPYRPISKTAGFKAYSKQGFSDAEQIRLAGLFKQIDSQGSYVMLSNSDPKNHDPTDNFFDTLYKDFSICRIPARRMINSDPSKRGNINEILVTNYLTPN